MASPQVAGVAALGFAAYKNMPCVRIYDRTDNPNRPAQNIIARVMAATADGLGSSGWPNHRSTRTGWGMPNAERVVRALLNINNEGNTTPMQSPVPPVIPTTPPDPTMKGLFD
jgi:hypothetical protein